MKKLRVLHVASFTGNIGDNANHTGFRDSFEKHIPAEIIYTQFEIREVFWRKKFFDKNFVSLANDHDLVVIGGGNYFELWVEHSRTGTSIDISLDDLRSIKTPIVFNALGVDPAQGASEQALEKFRKFLDVVIESPRMLLSCRNDGSMKTLTELIGPAYAKHFYHVPDAGLFTSVPSSSHAELDPNRKNLVVQIAGDMIEKRFAATDPGAASFEDFLMELAQQIEELQALGVNTILVPHIFRDLTPINALLDRLPDSIRRQTIAVAPYLVGQRGHDCIFDIYRQADLVLGMRFHANVCAMAMQTPCIGLVSYRQIDEFYNEMGLERFKIDVARKGFCNELNALARSVLLGETQFPDGLLTAWRKKLDDFHRDIANWLGDLEKL